MADDVQSLFAEYAAAYASGEQPKVREYLARAGRGADELGLLLDAFLLAAPRPAPNADVAALVAAWVEGEPPLVHLRASRGVRVNDVVDAIVEDAGVPPAKRAKVKRYYQRLEQGSLDPRGVSDCVWSVVRRLVGPVADAASSWGPQPAALDPVFYRGPTLELTLSAVIQEPESPAERDEVDELFTAGQ